MGDPDVANEAPSCNLAERYYLFAIDAITPFSQNALSAEHSRALEIICKALLGVSQQQSSESGGIKPEDVRRAIDTARYITRADLHARITASYASC